jgi:multiple sugar transport system permease protein
MAAALVCAAPVVVLYLAFQRYLVSGLTTGGVK